MIPLPARAVVCVLGCVALLPSLPAAGGEIRVLFWYDRGRPLDTFKFQAYDLRKQEFTPEVARWLNATRDGFPSYKAYARDIDLSRERGETDKLKIGSAITREFLGLGARYGYDFGGSTGTGAGSDSASRQAARSALPRPITRPGAAPYKPAESAAPSPFPVPYPRPHP